MIESITQRTIYMTFRGYCMHCGNPVGSGIHQDDSCDMSGAEERLTVLGMVWEEWLHVERAERVVQTAREYLKWGDVENREALREALAFCDQRDREIAEEKAIEAQP